MASKQQIEAFWKSEPFVLAGVSRNKKKFGYQAWAELRKKSYELIPLNPNAEEIDGVKCYKKVSDLPPHISSMIIITPKSQTAEIVKDAAAYGISNLWIQQTADTPEAVKLAKDAGMNLITGKCVMMFSEPVGGIHKFHRNILRFFGRLPK